jgi:hypothetical protein
MPDRPRASCSGRDIKLQIVECDALQRQSTVVLLRQIAPYLKCLGKDLASVTYPVLVAVHDPQVDEYFGHLDQIGLRVFPRQLSGDCECLLIGLPGFLHPVLVVIQQPQVG